MVTADRDAIEDACVETPGVDLRDWIAGPEAEPVRWEVLDDHPKIRERLEGAGYDGEFWFEVRPLSAVEEEQRITTSRYLEGESRQLTFDEHRHWRFTFLRQIQAFRLPEQRADGTYVERVGGVGSEDFALLYRLGRVIMSALKRKLREVNGELPAQRRGLAQLKKG
jgi:hypothetical protein